VEIFSHSESTSFSVSPSIFEVHLLSVIVPESCDHPGCSPGMTMFAFCFIISGTRVLIYALTLKLRLHHHTTLSARKTHGHMGLRRRILTRHPRSEYSWFHLFWSFGYLVNTNHAKEVMLNKDNKRNKQKRHKWQHHYGNTVNTSRSPPKSSTPTVD
jgi:hypothetical protein